MALQLDKLIHKVSGYDITLIAGKGGLYKPVNWIHMVENREATEFLVGGEIAFVTGIGLTREYTITDLIKDIYDKKAVSVVLNIGPFLEKIPQDVIIFGDENDFPIFTVPWKIHLAEIMHTFSYSLSKAEQHSFAVNAALKNAILFPKQEELYSVALSQNGFQPSWNYQACAVRVVDSKMIDVTDDRLFSICTSFEIYLHHVCPKSFAIFCEDSEIIIILSNHSEDDCKDFSQKAMDFFNKYLLKSESIIIGIGRSTKSVRCLYKSYNQALSIQKLHAGNKIDKNLIFYSDMGIYRLLMGIEDEDIIKDYYDKTLLPLEEYDNINNSDLCLILRTYLNNNGSVQKTADELFVHRNTINYKINKASEILGINLSVLENRFQISLGFMLKDML